MNVKLLRKVKKHILEEPKRFRMMGWVLRRNEAATLVEDAGTGSSRVLWEFPQCDTAACIGGWGVLLTAKRKVRTNDLFARAKRVFGLNQNQASILFGVYDWPGKFQNRFLNSKKPETRAKIAAARIEHFIKTNGAE
jgi:hypothetical protein